MADQTRCGSCNSCQTCNIGNQSTCPTYQTFSKKFGSFQFSVRPTSVNSMCPNAGQFNSSVWNEIYTHLNQRVNLPGSNYTIVSSTGSVAPFSASEFNNIASEIGAGTVSKNGLIYGSYFINLENAINSLTLDSKICENLCNIICQNCDGKKQQIDEEYCCSCQTACQNSCQSCNTSCDSGQDGNGNACGAVQW